MGCDSSNYIIFDLASGGDDLSSGGNELASGGNGLVSGGWD